MILNLISWSKILCRWKYGSIWGSHPIRSESSKRCISNLGKRFPVSWSYGWFFSWPIKENVVGEPPCSEVPSRGMYRGNSWKSKGRWVKLERRCDRGPIYSILAILSCICSKLLLILLNSYSNTLELEVLASGSMWGCWVSFALELWVCTMYGNLQKGYEGLGPIWSTTIDGCNGIGHG